MISNLLDKYLLYEIPRDPLTLTTMGLTAAAGAISAAGTIAGGNISNQIAQFKATQATMNAPAAIASAQRQALDKDLQTRMAISTLRARGAASGIDLTSGSATGLAGGIAARGAYQAGMALWKGENEATAYQNEAATDLASGQAAEIGAEYGAAGTIAGTGASMLQQYAFSKYMPLSSLAGAGIK